MGINLIWDLNKEMREKYWLRDEFNPIDTKYQRLDLFEEKIKPIRYIYNKLDER